jgi:hypothetical protein
MQFEHQDFNWTTERLVTVDWITSSLANDEVSTDEEMTAYFIANGLRPETVSLVMAQRNEALANMDFDLDCQGMDFDNAWNGFAN